MAAFIRNAGLNLLFLELWEATTRHGRLVEIFLEYCDMRGILRCSSNDCWPQGCLLGWWAGVTVFGIFGVQDVKFPPRPGELLLSLDALYWFLHFNWFLLLFLLQNLFPAYCVNFNSVYLIQSIFLFAILITWFILSHFYHTIFSYWFYQSRQCLSCCNRLSAFGFQSLPMILWSVSADPISKIMLMLIILELPFEFASSFQRLISNRLKDFNWQFCLWQVMSAALITLPILKV